jgi:filamentous hemagglutinin family protein
LRTGSLQLPVPCRNDRSAFALANARIEGERKVSTRRSHRCFAVLLIAALLSAESGFPAVSHAEVTASGLGTTVNQPATGVYNITGGTRPGGGTNLFHSFGNFSLTASESANFRNPSALPTTNILARVTGGNPSQIFGTINSLDFPTANLFLMNPAGIVFGPTAQLNVGASFHATTADYIKLGNDGIFYASPAGASVLTTAPPSAFGFLNPFPAAIDVASQLSVPPGRTLSFVGGTVNMGAPDGSAPAYVLAPAGRINLVAAGPGEATFDGTGFNIDTMARAGSVNIGGNSIIDGREVFIRGGQLTIGVADPTSPGRILPGLVSPGAFSLLGAGPAPDGGEVNVKVSGAVNISGTQPDPVLGTQSGIFVFAGSFFGVAPPSKVPDITIDAGSVSLSGLASILTNRVGPGDPAEVRINAADSVRIENGASVQLINTYEGRGDSLTINARDIELIGNNGASFTGLAAQAFFHPIYFAPPPAGSIDPALSFAQSGSITVNATNNLTLRNGAQITANRIEIGNGFVIAVNTFGSGNSGSAQITARESLNITGTASGIASQSVPPPASELNAFAALILGPGATFSDLALALGLPANADLFAVLGALNALGLTAVPDLTPGNGGNILINTPVLALSGTNSAIDSSTAWNGNAGQVNLNVGSLSVTGGAQVRSRSGLVNLETGAFAVGTGNAGNITVTSPGTITVSGQDSTISTTTFGDGNAGNISLTAGQVNVQDSGSITSATGGTIAGGLFVSTGRGGDINITAPQVNLLSGATISANSAGTASALAGSVNIVTNNLTMQNASITTQSALADGGNITVTTNGSQVYLLDSQITTSVQSGVGTGGNITVGSGDHPVEFVILNNGQIRADAFGGPGGNISIFADTFLTSGSVVSASSALAAPGVIDIQARFTNLSGNIAQLPENVVQAAALLRAACAARLSAGKSSSLVVAGREGVPLEPGGVMPSPLIAETSADLAPPRAGSDGHEWEPLSAAWRVSLRSKCSM